MDSTSLFYKIRSSLTQGKSVSEAKMMSSEAIKFKNDVFAFLSKNDTMVFKIPNFDFGTANFKCNLFNVFKNKPPMKNWVEVPFEENTHWMSLATKALTNIKNEDKMINIKEYRSYFQDLENNNNREWFLENKKRYETIVKVPFQELVAELINKTSTFDNSLETDPKESIMRINRDIRFSKDKTPYNTMMKAAIATGGRKGGNPGYYFGLSKDTLHLGGGLFNLDKEELQRIRTKITSNPAEFTDIVRSEIFIANFTELKGDKAKRIDKEFKECGEEVPEIYLKQFYAMKEIPLKNNLDLVKLATENFQNILPLINYLRD